MSRSFTCIKSAPIFLFYALSSLPSSCSPKNDFPIATVLPYYNSDKITTTQETSLPMGLALQIGKSI